MSRRTKKINFLPTHSPKNVPLVYLFVLKVLKCTERSGESFKAFISFYVIELATAQKKMGGIKKIIFLREPNCLYFVLETNRSQKSYFPHCRSRKSKMNVLFWKRFLNTKKRYLKRKGNFYLSRPAPVVFWEGFSAPDIVI